MELIFSTEVRIHLLKHFDAVPDLYIQQLSMQSGISAEQIRRNTGVAGSKFHPSFAKTPDDLYGMVLRLIKVYPDLIRWKQERCEINYDFPVAEYPDGIGVDNLCHIATLDETQKKRITTEQIQGYAVSTAPGNPVKSWTLNVILRKTQGHQSAIVTIFPGKYAPPFPNVFQEGSSDHKKSHAFWQDHVFLRA